MPVDKAVGASVTGGTMNRGGGFEMTVTRVGDESTLALIVRLMRDAQASRAPIQQLADRVSAAFVPAVMGISLLTVVAWLAWAMVGVAAVAVVRARADATQPTSESRACGERKRRA